LYCKKAIRPFSNALCILLSFWHTFSYFPIISKLLAQCADLSKSEGQLCCCHEIGLKPVLSLIYPLKGGELIEPNKVNHRHHFCKKGNFVLAG